MDAQVATTPGTTPLDHDHDHPGPAVYVKIGILLFILTAMEVAVYEIGYNHAEAGFGAVLHPVVIPVLMLLSAFKFALVAMFYMHLKQDSRLFTGVFVFPIFIAAVVIFALIGLFLYLHSLHY
jgi:cytochrome c oxidase subunit IV